MITTNLSLNIQTMSSREIADLTNKEHKNVMADIRNMCESLNIQSAEFSAYYKDDKGRTYPCFNLPKRETLILVSGYDVVTRAKIIDRWTELENQQKTNVYLTKLDEVRNTFDNSLYFAKVFGLEGNQALLAANKATVKLTGFNPLETLQIELVKEVQVLNLTPTQIGKELNPPLSAVATNKLLSSLGFQEKLHDQWVPTAKGKAFAIFLDTGKKHSDGTPITQLKWLSTLIPHLS